MRLITDMIIASHANRVDVKRYLLSSLALRDIRDPEDCIALCASSFIPQIY